MPDALILRMTSWPDPSDVDFATQHPLRVLIADDDETSRRLLGLMLGKLGYSPVACANGLECHAAALNAPFDLLLTDIDMPEMDGIECARALRSAGLDLPIIAITASATDAVRAECLEAGMDDFMRKPVSLAELTRSLREVSVRKGLNEANRSDRAH